jgi:RNA polymerase sigma-70 factor (ECF subfamily)
MPAVDDAALVRRCRAGDEGAWRELVERYSRYVYAIVNRGYRLDEYAAQDVFQEVFARTYERLGELRDPSALRPWIAQLTRRLAVDHVRADREIPGLDELQISDATEDPIGELESALNVEQMLGTLPEQFREVLERFFVRGEAYETIAAELDISAGTVASRISRGLEKLRGTLEAQAA